MSFVESDKIFGMSRTGAAQRLLNTKSSSAPEGADLLSAGSKTGAPSQPKSTKTSNKPRSEDLKQQRGTNKGDSIAPHLAAEVNSEKGYQIPLPKGSFVIDPYSIATIRIAGTATVAPPNSEGGSGVANYNLSTKMDAATLMAKYKEALKRQFPDTHANTFVYKNGSHFSLENGQPKIYLLDANHSLTQGNYPNRVGIKIITNKDGSMTAEHVINPTLDENSGKYFSLITNPQLSNAPSQAKHSYRQSYNSTIQSLLGGQTAKELEAREVSRGDRSNNLKRTFGSSSKAEIAYKFSHPQSEDSRIVKLAGHASIGKDKVLSYANERREHDNENDMYVRKSDGDDILTTWAEMASASADFNQNEDGIEISYSPLTPGGDWRSFGDAEKNARFAFGKKDPINLNYEHELTFGMAQYDKQPDVVTLLFDPHQE